MQKTDNLPVEFVRMGVLPKYRKSGLKYADRPHKIDFRVLYTQAQNGVLQQN